MLSSALYSGGFIRLQTQQFSWLLRASLYAKQTLKRQLMLSPLFYESEIIFEMKRIVFEGSGESCGNFGYNFPVNSVRSLDFSPIRNLILQTSESSAVTY